MENQSNKKILSECSNMQQSLYFGHGNPINSMKKLDCPFINRSSDAPADSALLTENLPNPTTNTKDWTPAKRKSEVEPNFEIANSQVTTSRNMSAADYQIIPEALTIQSEEDIKNTLKKWRRRSTIGARGSPENDYLIRYIAHQRRMQIQDATLQGSPFQHQNSLLKDKIAAFQSSFMALEEAEEKTIPIQNTSNTRLHEQSTLSQACPLASKEDTFEENLNHKFMNGNTSADTQMHSTIFPSQGSAVSGTSDISKAILVSPVNSMESESMSLIPTPNMDIPRTGCGTQFSNKDRDLSGNATFQHSCKKVRFSEEQSLKMFDVNKPPVTPSQKGPKFSSYLRSMLKKTPHKTLSEDLKVDDLQRTSEEFATPLNAHIKETKNNSTDLQVTSVRPTHTIAKRKAAQHKVRRKRGKRKKSQKALYGQRETASKKPRLSPILEAIEDVSFVSSRHQNTPTLNVSASDDSLSVLHVNFMNETAKDENSLLHIKEGDCQHSKLDLLEEDSTSLQFGENSVYSMENLPPRYALGINSPEKLNSSLNRNKQLGRDDCQSNESEVQLKELLNICGSNKTIKAEEVSFFTADAETELMSKWNRTNFRRRSSRRLTKHFPNAEKIQSKSPRDGAGVPGSNLEDLQPCSWAADNTELLSNLQKEGSVAKKVRRSMRHLKDVENEGLAWVQIPANDFPCQVPLESSCKVRRRLSSASPRESEHVVVSAYKPRRRKSICVMDIEKDKIIVFHVEKNRRASLGYRSDLCYQKPSEIRKFVKHQPAV